MRTIEFNFDLGEKVKTLFGDDGVVSMCALDGEGKVYFVKTSTNDQWYKEKQLSKA